MVTVVVEEEMHGRLPGDLACMEPRPNELCGRRALFDSMTSQARLIDHTYRGTKQPGPEPARHCSRIVHQTIREIIINLAPRLIKRKQAKLALEGRGEEKGMVSSNLDGAILRSSLYYRNCEIDVTLLR